MKELICISCPNGCHLKVDDENGYTVTGNKCERGIEYGKNELLNPVRVVTSTVRIVGGDHPMLPVKTDKPIAKDKIFEVMKLIDGITLNSPVKVGDKLMENILSTDVSIVACKNM